MGLDIRGKVSKKEYSYGYSALHRIRFLALVCCGMPGKIAGKDSGFLFKHFFFMPNETYPTVDEMMEYSWAVQQCGYYFPNLMFHSDCEGGYTKNGKVFSKPELMGGNSKGLLRELELLKEEMPEKSKESSDWTIFNNLYELVKDEVENGKGHIIFE